MSSETIDLACLLDLPDEQFLPEAYRALLGREPDSAGVMHYAQCLQRGLPRVKILAELRDSAEGRRQAASRPCEALDRVVDRYRIVRALPLGDWRWSLLPHGNVRASGSNRFDWVNWANAWIAGRGGSVASAQPRPTPQDASQFEQLQHKVDALVAGLQHAVNLLQAQGAPQHAVQPLRDALNEAGFNPPDAASVPWEARHVLHLLAQGLK